MKGTAEKRALSAEPATILVVEDERAILGVLRVGLVAKGYAVLEATTGRSALALVAERRPSLVLLDLDLRDADGFELAHHIRDQSRVPIVALSARSAEADIVAALDRGASDYVTKPFREAELFARIRASLRASAWTEDGDWVLGDLQVDSARRRVTVQGREIKLSVTEYKLLSALARAGGAVVTHQQLLRRVWGAEYLKEVTSLRVYVHHLREKLEPDPARPLYLLTEPGVGYRLCPSSDTAVP